MITNNGLDLIRNWLAGDSVSPPSNMAVGDDDTTPLATDTALKNEVLRKTFSAVTKGTTGQVTFQMTILTTEANGYTLKELGIFNASSSGTMLLRKTFDGVQKTSDFSLKIEVGVKIKRVGE